MSNGDQDAASPPARPTVRGRPRDPETDRRITAAAATLMLRRGFEKTTMDQVAAEAGVGKATVYRRWPSKDDLALAAMQELLDAELPQPDTGSVREDLLESYRSMLAFVATEQGAAFMRTSVVEAIRDDRIAALYREAQERREQQSRTTLERAVARGEVRADVDLDVAVQWLGGLTVSRIVSRRPLPRLDQAEAMVDFVLHGILAGRSPEPA